jgi:hypothetical protein
MKTSNGECLRSLPFQPPPPAPVAGFAATAQPWLSWLLARKLLLGVIGAVFFVGAIAGTVYVYSAQRSSAPPVADNKPNERMMETLGGLSASHLYQSYLNINLVADAVENDIYDVDEGLKMLTTVAKLMDGVDKQLEKLAKKDLSSEDQQDVQGMRAVSSLLRVQVAALRMYWRTGETKHLNTFHDTRKRAWKGLSDLLELD